MKTVDIVVATPSMLMPHKPSDYPNIKTVAVAGEPCPKGVVNRYNERPSTRLITFQLSLTIGQHIANSSTLVGLPRQAF